MNLFIACGVTVLVETLFFVLLGLRDRTFLLLCICANVATNLTLNLLVAFLAWQRLPLIWFVYPLEAAVVLSEFLIYGAVKGRSWKLFFLTLAANALSYVAGLLIFGHV